MSTVRGRSDETISLYQKLYNEGKFYLEYIWSKDLSNLHSNRFMPFRQVQRMLHPNNFGRQTAYAG